MKQLLSLLLVLCLCFSLTACGQTEETTSAETEAVQQTEPKNTETSADVPIPLGSFTAQTLTGETVTEAIFAEADLTVINVWGTYCGPCKEEMPFLGMLHNELENVQVLGIVIDVIDQQGQPDAGQIDLALELCAAANVIYPNLVINESLAMLGFAGVQGVPATVFVDCNGNLVGNGFYGALDEETWRQVIQERLEMAA